MGSFKFEKPVFYTIDTSIYEDETCFNSDYQTISDCRRQKIDALRLPDDKRLSLGASVLLEKGLHNLGIDTYEIQYGAHGKPYFAGVKDLFFSISHSGVYAVCAFYYKEIGVDVEQSAPKQDNLMRRVTTDAEYTWICGQSDEEKCQNFHKIWVGKESYLKFLGTGLSTPIKEVEIPLWSRGEIWHHGTRKAVNLDFYDINGYPMAMCYSV